MPLRNSSPRALDQMTLLAPNLMARLPVGFRLLVGKLARYAGVSALAMAVDLIAYSVAIGRDSPPAFAAGLGYFIGMVAHFLLSRRWVFQSQTSGLARWSEWANFAFTGLVGLLLTTFIVASLSQALSVGPTAQWAPFIAKFVAILVSFGVVFWLRNRFVFRSVPS